LVGVDLRDEVALAAALDDRLRRQVQQRVPVRPERRPQDVHLGPMLHTFIKIFSPKNLVFLTQDTAD
jgi:hypothetical protein